MSKHSVVGMMYLHISIHNQDGKDKSIIADSMCSDNIQCLLFRFEIIIKIEVLVRRALGDIYFIIKSFQDIF